MYRYRQQLQEEDNASKMRLPLNFLAVCSTFNSNKPENKHQFGVLLFTENTSKRSGVVSHEIAHAINYWWKHLGPYKWQDIPKKSKADERFAYIFGSMINQYWVNWYKL